LCEIIGMDHRTDTREEELHCLRLALATLALHLDAFEGLWVNWDEARVPPRRGFVRGHSKLWDLQVERPAD